MKLSFLFLLIFNGCIFYNAACQDAKHFTVGFMAGPSHNYRILVGGDGMLNLFDIPEAPKRGYRGAINVSYTVSNQIDFRSGIGYSKLGYQTQRKYFRTGTCIIALQMGLECDDYLQYQYDFHFVDVPLSVRYRPQGNIFFIQAGLNMGILAKAEEERTFKENGAADISTQELVYRNNEQPNLLLGFEFALGVELKVLKSHVFSVRPNFIYYPRAIEYELGPGRSLYAASLLFEFDF